MGLDPYPDLRSLNRGQNTQGESRPEHVLLGSSSSVSSEVSVDLLQLEVGIETSGKAPGQRQII